MMKSDTTLEDLELTRFNNYSHDINRNLTKSSKFTNVELQSIILVYYKLLLARRQEERDRNLKYISHEQFAQFLDTIFDIKDMLTVDRIRQIIAKTSRNNVTPEEWIFLFEMYFHSNLEKKIHFCFEVYNLEGNSILSRDNILHFLRTTFVGDEEDTDILKEEFLEIITRKVDQDRDGKISFEDYSKTVYESPCMLEFLGKCIPDIETIAIAAHICNIPSVLQKYGFL